MEEIKSKAYDDELNKSQEEIHRAPRKKIPVPKVKKDDKEKEEVKDE